MRRSRTRSHAARPGARRACLALPIAALLAVSSTLSAAPRYVESPPLDTLVNTPVSAVHTGTLRVPVITWGGDIATVLANGNDPRTQPGSLFAAAGVDLELVREDIFARQVERYLAGESPFLRGTLGMVNLAADALGKDPRTRPVVVHQMTWSAGGDALVVKEGVRAAADLAGKTIALQAYGPHVDYLGKVLGDAGLALTDVMLKWLPDLTGTDDTPMAAFYEDDVDAAFTIIPDALALTSGGNVGTGAEASVKNARILLSTKTANRIVTDVYAVRSDYLEANRDTVESFVTALLDAQAKLADVVANRGAAADAYRDTMRASAALLFDTAEAVADTEGLYADCEFVGLDGNVRFFTDNNYPRRFAKLNDEIQGTLASFGLARGDLVLASADWNWGAIEAAVGPRQRRAATQQRFDQSRVAEVVTRRQQQGALEEGELFSFEVFFKPNQKGFSADLYRESFDRVIELASTYGGAIITVEGHSDPLGYLRKKKEGAPSVVLGRIKQSARNLSISRAQAVRDSMMGYAETGGISLDASQFAVVGHGIAQPASGVCGTDPCAPQSEKEWRSNMRVEFRILQVEAEADVFKPL